MSGKLIKLYAAFSNFFLVGFTAYVIIKNMSLNFFKLSLISFLILGCASHTITQEDLGEFNEPEQKINKSAQSAKPAKMAVTQRRVFTT